MTATITPDRLGIIASILKQDNIDESVTVVTNDLLASVHIDRLKYRLAAIAKRLNITPEASIVTSGLKLNLTLTCSVNVTEPPYLEIEPEILWIWTMPADNNVYSNTDWLVN